MKKDHDERFDRIKKDPRFQHPKEKVTKVIVDDRFKSLFTDEDFSGSMDKYGRKNATTLKENLSRFYRLEDEENTKTYDPARGEGISESSDSEDIEEFVDKVEQQVFEQLHPHYQSAQAPTGQPSSRLALLNLDWDQITSQDIFQLLYSFKPQLGSIISVKKYISAFGKERLEQEKLHGPPSNIFSLSEEQKIIQLEEKDEGEEFVDHELRKYQLERLKYYYVIVETDCIETARHIYQECDGREFEKSCNVLDIRYVSDDEVFEEKDIAEYASQLTAKYQPRIKATRALQHSRVKLTWDDDDPKRSHITRARHANLDLISDEDFAAYLASSASEDEAKPENNISMYRSLLESCSENVFQGKERKTTNDNDGNENMNMQMTFHTALDVKMNKPIVDKKKIFKKEKERLSLVLDDESSMNERNHFNMREIIKAEKKGTSSDSFNIKVEDPRFTAVFDSSQYAIDPTHPNFKRTKNMMKLLEAKRKKTAKEVLHE